MIADGDTMVDFKNDSKQAGNSLRMGCLFNKPPAYESSLVAHEIKLSAAISGIKYMNAVRKAFPNAQFKVDDNKSVAVVGIGSITLMNKELKLSCSRISEKDWLIVTNGLITTNGD